MNGKKDVENGEKCSEKDVEGRAGVYGWRKVLKGGGG